jgi:hypothetical protein
VNISAPDLAAPKCCGEICASSSIDDLNQTVNARDLLPCLLQRCWSVGAATGGFLGRSAALIDRMPVIF